MPPLKRKKRPEWRVTVELITKERTYTSTKTFIGDDPFDDEAKDDLFGAAGVPDDMGPDDLLKLTFIVEKL